MTVKIAIHIRGECGFYVISICQFSRVRPQGEIMMMLKRKDTSLSFYDGQKTNLRVNYMSASHRENLSTR